MMGAAAQSGSSEGESDVGLDYFLRVQSTCEPALSESIDHVLRHRPEDPLLGIAEQLLRRCGEPANGAWSSFSLLKELRSLRNRVRQLELDSGATEAHPSVDDHVGGTHHLTRFQPPGGLDGRHQEPPSLLLRRSESSSLAKSSNCSFDSEDEQMPSMDSAQCRAAIGRLQEAASVIDQMSLLSSTGEADSTEEALSDEVHAKTTTCAQLTSQTVSELRCQLSNAQKVVTRLQHAIDALLVDAPSTSRAGYLMTLDERIGARPVDRTWEDEWVDAKMESYVLSNQHEFATEEYVVEHADVETTKEHFAVSIRSMVERGWSVKDATTYRLLSTVAGAISRALREGDPSYAASTYALREALSNAMPHSYRRPSIAGGEVPISRRESEVPISRRESHGPEDDLDSAIPKLCVAATPSKGALAQQGTGLAHGACAMPPAAPAADVAWRALRLWCPCCRYWHVQGMYSLSESDPSWLTIEVADRNGFRETHPRTRQLPAARRTAHA